MSRVGNKPITIPEGVEVRLDGRTIVVKGPKGELQQQDHMLVEVSVADGQVTVAPKHNQKLAKMLYGTYRSLIQNMVVGVTEGFTKTLELKGVGYRVSKQGEKLVFNIGFKHTVDVDIPPGLEVDVKDSETFAISGIDKHQVGQFAATLRAMRPPEVYKGHGIRYENERVRIKEIKTGAK